MTPFVTRLRRTTVVLAAAVAVVVPGATPAMADVPEGWSDPEPVNLLESLLVLGAIPLLLFVLITAAVLLPALVRGERIKPGSAVVEDQWIGGPRTGTAELGAPDSVDSQAGGASARW